MMFNTYGIEKKLFFCFLPILKSDGLNENTKICMLIYLNKGFVVGLDGDGFLDKIGKKQ